MLRNGFSIIALLCFANALFAGVGDPQLKTDHPWYPGELAMSNFERLFATQAELYERVTGAKPTTDEQKALASWLWRNTHFAHGEEGREMLFPGKFDSPDNVTRDYWTGLYSHGFALCGTTHWPVVRRDEYALGHGRGRAVGVAGHNSFEVFLTGGAYGKGKWALLDHDLSTVIFSDDGSRLLSIPEIKANPKFTDPRYKPGKQHGWLVAGLHRDDAKGVYGEYNTAEYLAGYAGPPPMVHLRRGEKLRRYFAPGLEDGKTFVFWGRNYNTAGIPGPERSRTWVNQPEKMFNAENDAGHHDGQARYGNAVFTYEPNFRDPSPNPGDGSYQEAFEGRKLTFRSPYVIAATPPTDKPWAIYDQGCTNGLVVEANRDLKVYVSVDGSRSWVSRLMEDHKVDFTDDVKGHRSYLMMFEPKFAELEDAGLRITTICQCNVAVLPRLKDQGTEITYAASNQAIFSAGPTIIEANQHVIDGNLGEQRAATFILPTPHKEPITHIYGVRPHGLQQSARPEGEVPDRVLHR